MREGYDQIVVKKETAERLRRAAKNHKPKVSIINFVDHLLDVHEESETIKRKK